VHQQAHIRLASGREKSRLKVICLDRSGVAVPDPGSVPFWPRDTGWVKIKILDPGWTSRIIIPRALKQFFGFKCLNSLMRIRDPEFFYPGSGMEKFGSRIREKFGSGIREKYPDRQHWIEDTVGRYGTVKRLKSGNEP
jgi:hypothetical protein